jgi:ATP-dependent Lhr-like helicase
MSYQLLSEPIRRFIREKGWDELRPIQNAAIERIITTDNNYILVSKTASGKTEAAFLPILSKVNFNNLGVQVLYVSPLIALINDQFYRIEELCKNLDVTVTKWHGEANKTEKNKLLKQPSGIVLITPESLEAMFVNKSFNVKHLFSKLKYVVIDEIHSFIGTDRGIQLQSLLSRLQNIQSKPFNIVGLSATMSLENRFIEAKEFTGNVESTKILIDKSQKDIIAEFRYFKSVKDELPLDLLKNIYLETEDKKVLIFPNSRGRAEEVAVKLKKISDRVNGHPNYFSHHSSVVREEREFIEYFAKNNKHESFCISCTSTLELGIDIGTVDEVVQIDATHSIASLIQRVGRSGRKEGVSSNLFLYSTNKWSLLQSVACWLLYNEGYIEPPQKNDFPYDILVHQALSITKGNSGIILPELIDTLKQNAAFIKIDIADIKAIVHYLIEIDLLEKVQNEVIIGIEGEIVVNNRNFYSVFKTEENFKVIYNGNTVGDIPFSPQLSDDENLLLAAKIWKIKFIDHKAKKIEVSPAKDGKKPIFFGGGPTIHSRIREKMLKVLYTPTAYTFLDQASLSEIEMFRNEFSAYHIKKIQFDRPLVSSDLDLLLYTFSGTKVNRTIQLILNTAGIKNKLDDSKSCFEIEVTKKEFHAKWEKIKQPFEQIDIYISALLEKNPAILDFSKWGVYLPESYQVKILRDKYFDIEQTQNLLEQLRLIENK